MSTAQYQVDGFRQMAADELQGGIIVYGEQRLAAAMGDFEVRDKLTSTGFMKVKSMFASIATEDLAAGTVFHEGEPVTAIPNTGDQHQCKIVSRVQYGALIELELADVAQAGDGMGS